MLKPAQSCSSQFYYTFAIKIKGCDGKKKRWIGKERNGWGGTNKEVQGRRKSGKGKKWKEWEEREKGMSSPELTTFSRLTNFFVDVWMLELILVGTIATRR